MEKANQQIPPVSSELPIKASNNLSFTKALAYGFVVVSVGISIAVGGYLLCVNKTNPEPTASVSVSPTLSPAEASAKEDNSINTLIGSERYIETGCKIGGCSGTICHNETDELGITACNYRNEYACYKTARCEKQTNGKCAWTQTSELQSCLKNYPRNL